MSDWFAIDQETIDRFADVTGDRQWIHVDVERARRESPGGTTIAHGYLTLSLLPAMRAQVGVVPPGATRTINYGLDRVRFLEPVPAGARVRGRIVLSGVDERANGLLVRTTNTVEIEGSERPALVAETLVLVIGDSG